MTDFLFRLFILCCLVGAAVWFVLVVLLYG